MEVEKECDPWLLSVAEILDVPASELIRIDEYTVARKTWYENLCSSPQGVSFNTMNIDINGVDPVLIASNIYGCLSAFEDDKPGVPLVEHFREIATKLKEIEVERERRLKELELKREYQANQET